MSVLYRALWTSEPDNTDEHLARSRGHFCAWATEAAGGGSLDDGSTTVTLNRVRVADRQEQRNTLERLITLRSVGSAASTQGFEGVTRETSDGMTWTTLVRVVAAGGMTHLWVENQAESDRLVGVRLSVGRPRIVDDLIAASPHARLGGSGLLVEPQLISSDAVPVLVEHLRSAERTLPTIVVSQPNPGNDDTDAWLRRAARIARRAVGVATVATIDRDAVATFSRQLGQLATWDGSVRVYAPVPVVDGEGYRHRYTLRYLLEEHDNLHIDRIVYGVCSLSTRRRPEAAFDVFAAPTSAPVDLREYLTIEHAESMIRDVQSQLNSATEEAHAAVEEQDQLSRDLSMKVGHLDRLHRALEQQGHFGLFYETQHDPGSGIPDEADSVDTAIILAMDYLCDWLVIHEDAPQDLDGINSAPQATAWGNTSWRGFRALAGFAEARTGGFAGGFYDWCKSDPPLGWPATSKKLSMTESPTVQNNSTLSGKRMLPIATDVDSSGHVLMLAHLKIAQGGGNLAPRVYFYDDTAGPTKKVHVGFVGPHYLMPNTKS